MSTSLDQYLRGPIDIAAPFVLTSLIPNGSGVQPAVLTAETQADQSISYRLETNLNSVLNPNLPQLTLPVFTVTGTLDNLTFKDNINQGYLGFDLSYNLINVNQPIQLKATQFQVANWNLPDIFLSNIVYILSSSDGVQLSPNDFYIVPGAWYFTCTNDTSSCCVVEPQTLDQPGSLFNWFCVHGTGPWCQDPDTGETLYPVSVGGWTNLADCNLGFNYTYCPPSDECGTDNCNGPCSNTQNVCTNQSNQFSCRVDLNRSSNVKWWETWVFIGSMIGLGVLVLIFIILMVIVERHGKEVS